MDLGDYARFSEEINHRRLTSEVNSRREKSWIVRAKFY